MSKKDINGKTGGKVRVPTDKYRKRSLERTFLDMDREEREKNKEKKPGARELVIIAYCKRNKIEDAYIAMKVFNQKVGTEVYTKEVVDKWILEYQQSVVINMFDDEGR